ncbi:P44/Msp2 family outer membrane protein [Wolbachia endosymbiont of Howardula sp.]|uniref:P44/Msp2 family outer membrane protein n=1 Tax=Wolbachia endosymbiont of Howardula sp. TaxID=2916816 RepID=UPI00217EC0CB|nr:P44/Msp2 family outer membrane protein [Wolbachia endosymbiont of Howardula sp.]UWI83334.1 P44/Msp2 family outer membrane protein [Wolbachia endosymbiont of Howardula sp.]
MNYKKCFLSIVLVTLLSISHSSFSLEALREIYDYDEETNYYISLQYNSSFFPVNKEIIHDQNHNHTNKIRHPFKSSFFSGSAALGYQIDDLRIELEGIYSPINENILSKISTGYNTELANDFSIISGIVNLYYDIIIEDFSLTPYVGLGVGTSYIRHPNIDNLFTNNSNIFAFAYQAKAGIGYEMTPEITIYAGARYFGTYGTTFEQLVVQDNRTQIIYSTLGAETGITFNF